MSINQRKFAKPVVQEKLTEKIDDALSLSIEHIELRMVRSQLYRAVTIGVEEVKIEYAKVGAGRNEVQLIKKILKSGELIFNPDKRGVCWGYLADTAANRIFLAKTLRDREKWFTIADITIRNEIVKLAMKLGVDTVPHKDDPLNHMLAKKNPQVAEKQKLEAELVLARAEIARLKSEDLETESTQQVEPIPSEADTLAKANAKLVKMAQELDEARKDIKEPKEEAVKKPLEGVHINKAKLGITKINTDKVGLK